MRKAIGGALNLPSFTFFNCIVVITALNFYFSSGMPLLRIAVCHESTSILVADER